MLHQTMQLFHRGKENIHVNIKKKLTKEIKMDAAQLSQKFLLVTVFY